MEENIESFGNSLAGDTCFLHYRAFSKKKTCRQRTPFNFSFLQKQERTLQCIKVSRSDFLSQKRRNLRGSFGNTFFVLKALQKKQVSLAGLLPKDPILADPINRVAHENNSAL